MLKIDTPIGEREISKEIYDLFATLPTKPFEEPKVDDSYTCEWKEINGRLVSILKPKT